QLLDLVVPHGTLGRDDDRRRPFRECRNRAADHRRTVTGGLALENDLRRFHGGDDLHFDDGRGNGVLRETLPRGYAKLDRGAGVEVNVAQERQLEMLAVCLRRQVIDDDLIERLLVDRRGGGGRLRLLRWFPC